MKAGRRTSGRAKQAASNDGRILDAARKVFLANPSAPMSDVAAEAGVGISALYLRHASKADLLQHLCRQGLLDYLTEAEASLADTRDEWTLFCAFMHRLVETNSHALTVRLAGTFEPAADLYELANRAQAMTETIFEKVLQSGVLRPGINVHDIGLSCEMLATVSLGNETRDLALRRRYLDILLEGMRSHAAGPVPGEAPTWQEVQARWQPK